MPLLAFGINHRTAPVDVREKLAFHPESVPLALRQLTERSEVEEAAILSTCNRTEIYCGVSCNDDCHDLLAWLSSFHSLALPQLQPHVYLHPDRGAVRHMMRVAAGLDSLVLGEPQILGQVKQAYQIAEQAGTLGSCLKRLFQHCFAVAKQVRTDTAIGSSPVSVAYAAVALARRIYAHMERQTALLIGAGETIDLVARYLRDAGIGQLIIANRTFERAHLLAQRHGGFAISLHELEAHLGDANVIVSSTGSADLIVDVEAFTKARRRRRRQPVFIVDIAVPRDIDPAIAKLGDTFLYTVDDLGEIIDENRRSREVAAVEAEEIVDAQADEFMDWLRLRQGSAAICALRGQGEAMRDMALARALAQLRRGRSAEDVVQQLAHNLTNKLLHAPSVGLREACVRGDHDAFELIKSVHGIE